jgi:hypothetical protein
MLAPGAHVNAIGANAANRREVDADCVLGVSSGSIGRPGRAGEFIDLPKPASSIERHSRCIVVTGRRSRAMPRHTLFDRWVSVWKTWQRLDRLRPGAGSGRYKPL